MGNEEHKKQQRGTVHTTHHQDECRGHHLKKIRRSSNTNHNSRNLEHCVATPQPHRSMRGKIRPSEFMATQ